MRQRFGVSTLTWSPDDRCRSSTTGVDARVFVRDAETFEVSRKLHGHALGVNAVAWNSDSTSWPP